MPTYSSTHHRRSIRLPGFDYSQPGAYFITMITYERQLLFCEPIHNQMFLNQRGIVVRNEWIKTAAIRPEIQIGPYVIMPNHFHAIVWITDESVGAYGHTPLHPPVSFASPSKTLGALVRGFKGAVTSTINRIYQTPRLPVWQRNYYEHIIRSEQEYEQIAMYIQTNPENWITDSEYCAGL